MTTASRRPVGFLSALPPYLGGKGRLLGHIVRVLPRPREALTVIDAFLGGGSVSLMAKARGCRVLCNDIAARSAIVGRALIANDRITLSENDVTRLFAAEPGGPPGFVERVYGGEVVPVRQARFLDGAFPVVRELAEPKRSLLLLLLLRFILAMRPMGNFGAKRIVEQMSDGKWEEMNAAFLRDPLVRRIEAHPFSVLDDLRERINAGVFANGQRNEVWQGDVFEFLGGVEGDVVYLDPPYAGTSSYEAALKPLDSILAGEPVALAPSEFSGPRALDALDRLVAACSHIPYLVLSYGNAQIDADGLECLVARHRHDVKVETIRYAHLASLASEDSKKRNLELLVRAGRAK